MGIWTGVCGVGVGEDVPAVRGVITVHASQWLIAVGIGTSARQARNKSAAFRPPGMPHVCLCVRWRFQVKR